MTHVNAYYGAVEEKEAALKLAQDALLASEVALEAKLAEDKALSKVEKDTKKTSEETTESIPVKVKK